MKSYFIRVVFLALVISTSLANAEGWVAGSNPVNVAYQTEDGRGYYRKVSVNEFYYAPDIYVMPSDDGYYYKKEDTGVSYNSSGENSRNVQYAEHMIYYPEVNYPIDNDKEYYYNYKKAGYMKRMIKNEEPKVIDYPLYFDN